LFSGAVELKIVERLFFIQYGKFNCFSHFSFKKTEIGFYVLEKKKREKRTLY